MGMKVSIEVVDNGWVVRQENTDLPAEEVVMGGSTDLSEDQPNEIRMLLHTVLDQLGLHGSKHYPRVWIVTKMPDGRYKDYDDTWLVEEKKTESMPAEGKNDF